MAAGAGDVAKKDENLSDSANEFLTASTPMRFEKRARHSMATNQPSLVKHLQKGKAKEVSSGCIDCRLKMP